MKKSLIPKTKDHRLEGFLYPVTKAHSVMYYLSNAMNALEVVAVEGRSIRGAVWQESVQESVGRAVVVKRMPFLVVHSRDSDCPSVQSSQLSDRVLAAECTDAGNDEQSSVVGQYNSAVGRAVAGQRLQLQSLRRGTQRPWSPISRQRSRAFTPERRV